VSEEKRIYVVVAETVKADAAHTLTVVQPAGRIAAQVAHVVSKMRVAMQAKYEPITTIILSVPDSSGLKHIDHVLAMSDLAYETFWDTNEEYGKGFSPDYQILSAMTALCTYPIDPTRREGLLDHLPLWTPKETVQTPLWPQVPSNYATYPGAVLLTGRDSFNIQG
jgi:hypothetical protein